MKGEIDRNFYCSGYLNAEVYCLDYKECCEAGARGHCARKHRKWPTPAQFREEHGEEWTGAVYAVCGAPCESGKNYTCSQWSVYGSPRHARTSYNVQSCSGGGTHDPYVVCASTPWGRPPDDWRPNND